MFRRTFFTTLLAPVLAPFLPVPKIKAYVKTNEWAAITEKFYSRAALDTLIRKTLFHAENYGMPDELWLPITNKQTVKWFRDPL